MMHAYKCFCVYYSKSLIILHPCPPFKCTYPTILSSFLKQFSFMSILISCLYIFNQCKTITFLCHFDFREEPEVVWYYIPWKGRYRYSSVIMCLPFHWMALGSSSHQTLMKEHFQNCSRR